MHDILNGLLDYVILGLTRGSMYALIALGYTLVYGVLQLINFAHSEVFMSGAFGSYLIISMFVDDGATPPWYGVAALVLLGLLSGALVGAIVAFLLERVAYRRLRHAPRLAPARSPIRTSARRSGWWTRWSKPAGCRPRPRACSD